MKSFIALSCLTLMTLSIPLHAEDGQKPTKTNEELFARLDKDENGSLTLEEFKARKMKRAQKKFADDPKKIKKTEKKLTKGFGKADTNADGAVNFEEYAAYKDMQAQKKAAAAAQ